MRPLLSPGAPAAALRLDARRDHRHDVASPRAPTNRRSPPTRSPSASSPSSPWLSTPSPSPPRPRRRAARRRGRPAAADTGHRVVRLTIWCAGAVAVVVLACSPLIPHAFTSDGAVISRATGAFVVMGLMLVPGRHRLRPRRSADRRRRLWLPRSRRLRLPRRARAARGAGARARPRHHRHLGGAAHVDAAALDGQRPAGPIGGRYLSDARSPAQRPSRRTRRPASRTRRRSSVVTSAPTSVSSGSHGAGSGSGSPKTSASQCVRSLNQ